MDGSSLEAKHEVKAEFQQGPHDQDNNGLMHCNRGSLPRGYDGGGDGTLPLTYRDNGERVNVVVATEMRRRRREGLVSFAMFDECDGWMGEMKVF